MLENDNVKDSSAKNGIWGAYSDNTAGSGSYTGSNGIKVGLAGGLEFNNGEWMQMQLCQETSDNSYKCKRR